MDLPVHVSDDWYNETWIKQFYIFLSLIAISGIRAGTDKKQGLFFFTKKDRVDERRRNNPSALFNREQVTVTMAVTIRGDAVIRWRFRSSELDSIVDEIDLEHGGVWLDDSETAVAR